MAGRMGGKRVTQVGLTVHEIDPSGTCSSSRGRARPEERLRRGQEDRPWPAPKAPILDKAGKSQEPHARGGRLRHRAEAAPRARDRARRAERGPRRHARREEPRPGRGRALEAVAPEGHRPRPRRLDPRAALDRRWGRFPADDAQLRVEGEPQGPPRSDAQRPLRPRAGRHARRARSEGVRCSVHEGGRRVRRRLGQGSAAAARGAARGRGADQVVPQPRARGDHGPDRARGAPARPRAIAPDHGIRARARAGKAS